MDIEIICNTSDEVLFAHIDANAALDRAWVTEVEAHGGHAVIVGGGPSLIDHLPSIRTRQALGQTIFALNGAAGFLVKHGIIPEYQVMMDAWERCADFIEPAAGTHLLASQCHPDVVAKLPQALLWHTATDGVGERLPDRETILIGGGLTVGLSSMCLVYALGFRKIHCYAYDSSHREDENHAYPQPQKNLDPACIVTLNDKTFRTTLVMARQAELFPQVCNNLIDLGCIITMDADGLIMEVMRSMHYSNNQQEN